MQVSGRVVKLDRGFPLIEIRDGTRCRCEHATALLKGKKTRAAVGDNVVLEMSDAADCAQLVQIQPRRNALVRKDPAERAIAQVLAANFDLVLVAQPLSHLNMRRLERELVVAFETGADVGVVLTKADLAESSMQASRIEDDVCAIAGDATVYVVSEADPESIKPVRDAIAPGTMAVLIGRSGVGKSSLVNMLVGSNIQQTTPVRDSDGKGRHTTVSREIVDIPHAGCIVDMPGVRGLGMWEAEEGIETAFADIEQAAEHCRFRDCRHGDEPGCAVRQAVDKGRISSSRLMSYLRLRDENEYHAQKKRQKNWR